VPLPVSKADKEEFRDGATFFASLGLSEDGLEGALGTLASSPAISLNAFASGTLTFNS
jgi:hypothetical protein